MPANHSEIEKKLWASADELRANSNLKSSEYSVLDAHGAVFDTIIVDTFRMLQVVKPPLALTDVFKSIASPIFETVLNLLNKNANLRKTRDLLLPKLISGEVDVERLEVDTKAVMV